jgi:hypothetical protein
MKTTSRGALAAALAACALLAAAGARADSACVADAQKLCAGILIGDGRVLACLQSSWNKLSGPCIQEIQAVQARAREIDLACSADVWSFCRGVPSGEGRIRACLWPHWKELSSTCRDEASRVAEKAQALRGACGPDAEQLCPGMKPGGGLLYLCLKSQESQASGACQRALR